MLRDAAGVADGPRTHRPRPLVLIVEDQRDLRHLYAEQLAQAGFDVIEAADGATAILRSREAVPDLVLMDLSLPGIDGWDATQRLKHDAATAAIPVIALTAHDGGDDLRRATDAGCEWFIPKPCPPDALITEVRRVLAARP